MLKLHMQLKIKHTYFPVQDVQEMTTVECQIDLPIVLNLALI